MSILSDSATIEGVRLRGWVELGVPASISPFRPRPSSRKDSRLVELVDVPPELPDGSYAEVSGDLQTGILRVTQATVASPPSPEPRGYRELVAMAQSWHRATNSASPTAELRQLEQALQEVDSLLSVARIAVADGVSVLIASAEDPALLQDAIKTIPNSGAVIVVRSRWTRREIESARALAASIPDEHVVEYSERIGAHGDLEIDCLTFRANSIPEGGQFTQFPRGLLSIDSWIKPF